MANPVVALFFATHDGQSRRIAEHIAHRLGESGVVAVPRNADEAYTARDLRQAAVVVLVAAIRYGRHLPQAERLLAIYQSLHRPPPLAFASVNLTARKEGKTSATGNAYLRKLIARFRLAPALAVAFAGKLDYQRYGWSDRLIIRFIMLLTSGPTDPTTCIEYTSWPAVDEFAAGIAQLATRPPSGSIAPDTAAQSA